MSATALSIMTFSITKLSIMTLSITIKNAILTIMALDTAKKCHLFGVSLC
jgi:hypothetical protein